MQQVDIHEEVDLEMYIKISANSIGDLRKSDIYRVIDSLRSDNLDGVSRSDLATFIVAKRPDLVAEVTQVMLEEFPEDGWTPDVGPDSAIPRQQLVAGARSHLPGYSRTGTRFRIILSVEGDEPGAANAFDGLTWAELSPARKLAPALDVVHRGWLANLKEGDRVEVPYSLAKDDIRSMTVFENDGVWIRLLPDGFSSEIDHTVLANAVSGVLHYAPVQIVPPGTTSGSLRESGDHSFLEHDFRNFHRQLCERFGYSHDEVDWKRDQISLIEWIANCKEDLERQRDDLLKAMTIIAAQSVSEDWSVEEAYTFIKQHAREVRDAVRGRIGVA